MINKNFYPTPAKLLDKIFPPIKSDKGNFTYSQFSKYKLILEPSAGKGDIIDYIRDNLSHSSSTKLYAIENEPDLQTILKTKSCKLLHDDFLTFTTHLAFDLIVMNPPFDAGARHLLHAYDISKGGDIVCILNAETIRNPSTKEQQLLANIIQDNKSVVTYHKNAFANAERKTKVEIAVVKITKPAQFTFDFDPGDMKREDRANDMPDLETDNMPAVMDVMKNYEDGYNASIQAYREYLIAASKYNYYCGIFDNDSLQVSPVNYHTQIELINSSAWSQVLRETKYDKFMTAKIRDGFMRKFEDQKDIAFTKDNMMVMIDTLMQARGKIMNECLEASFDNLCNYSEANKSIIEHWKTNDAYKVNMKCIIPYGISARYRGFELNYRRTQELNDLTKVLCHMMGDKYDYEKDDPGKILPLGDHINAQAHKSHSSYTGQLLENSGNSRYFYYKFYKKGTIHLKFLDEQVHRLFNIKVAEIKGHPLPADTAKSEREYDKKTARQASNKTRKSPKVRVNSTTGQSEMNLGQTEYKKATLRRRVR